MVKTRTVKELAPNPKNPRKISPEKLEQLKKALAEFGDLSGFVYNRKTKHIISGHQRAKVFDEASEVEIDKKYKKPTATGTVAEGFVTLHGERFRYREVSWDEPKEKAATIAANQSAGDWDDDILKDWFVELEDYGMDSDLTMFTESERRKYMPTIADEAVEDDEKPSKGKKQKSRSASDDVKGVNLMFTEDKLAEFMSALEYFQIHLQIYNVSDVVLEVLKSAKESMQDEDEKPQTKIRRKEA